MMRAAKLRRSSSRQLRVWMPCQVLVGTKSDLQGSKPVLASFVPTIASSPCLTALQSELDELMIT
jgi:hypothetical protein